MNSTPNSTRRRSPAERSAAAARGGSVSIHNGDGTGRALQTARTMRESRFALKLLFQ